MVGWTANTLPNSKPMVAMSNVTAFRKRKHRIDRLRPKPDPGRPRCEHSHLLVSERRCTVSCKDCEEALDPLEALLIVAQPKWLEEWACELAIERDVKRVSRVQRAAFQCLYEAGITPERYAAKWKDKEQAQLAELEEQVG